MLPKLMKRKSKGLPRHLASSPGKVQSDIGTFVVPSPDGDSLSRVLGQQMLYAYCKFVSSVLLSWAPWSSYVGEETCLVVGLTYNKAYVSLQKCFLNCFLTSFSTVQGDRQTRRAKNIKSKNKTSKDHPIQEHIHLLLSSRS